MSDKPKTETPKTEKPIERMQCSWRMALEFGVNYPVGKSERDKLVDAYCGKCGRSR